MLGSYEDVKTIFVDFKNFSRNIKIYIGKHDADPIVKKFKDIQASSDKEFQFEYMTYLDNHLAQPFWAYSILMGNFDATPYK